MESSAGTETFVLPVMIEPIKPVPVAVIVALPAFSAETSPEPLTEAAAVLLELHETEPVMFWLLPSVNVPVAVSCRVVPGWTDGFAGVIAMEARAGGATVSTVDPITEEYVAEMVAGPCAWPTARPGAAIVATEVSEELHVAMTVISWVVPLKSPVAVNCCLRPLGIEGFAGVTVTDVRLVAGITVSVVDPRNGPRAAVILTIPCLLVAVTSPVPLTVAMVISEDCHVT